MQPDRQPLTGICLGEGGEVLHPDAQADVSRGLREDGDDQKPRRRDRSDPV